MRAVRVALMVKVTGTCISQDEGCGERGGMTRTIRLKSRHEEAAPKRVSAGIT